MHNTHQIPGVFTYIPDRDACLRPNFTILKKIELLKIEHPSQKKNWLLIPKNIRLEIILLKFAVILVIKLFGEAKIS